MVRNLKRSKNFGWLDGRWKKRKLFYFTVVISSLPKSRSLVLRNQWHVYIYDKPISQNRTYIT